MSVNKQHVVFRATKVLTDKNVAFRSFSILIFPNVLCYQLQDSRYNSTFVSLLYIVRIYPFIVNVSFILCHHLLRAITGLPSCDGVTHSPSIHVLTSYSPSIHVLTSLQSEHSYDDVMQSELSRGNVMWSFDSWFSDTLCTICCCWPVCLPGEQSVWGRCDLQHGGTAHYLWRTRRYAHLSQHHTSVILVYLLLLLVTSVSITCPSFSFTSCCFGSSQKVLHAVIMYTYIAINAVIYCWFNLVCTLSF